MRTLPKLPGSLLLFGLAAVVFGLQLNAYFGAFLLFLGAPYWPVFTVNAGFVGLAAEALVRPGFRFWIVLPVLWFGGYAGLAALSQHEAARLKLEVAEFNAGKSVPFFKDTQALVVDDKTLALGGLSVDLLGHYNLPVVYATRVIGAAATPGPPHNLAWRLGGQKLCETIQKGAAYRAAGIQAYGMYQDGKFLKNVCNYYAPEEPSKPVVGVRVKSSSHGLGVTTWTIDDIAIASPDGHAVIVRSGTVQPLGWWPLPVFGCGLGDAGLPARCVAAFMPAAPQPLGRPGGSAETIAEALGLKPSSAHERSAEIQNMPMPASLRGIIEPRVVLSLANLDAIIADPNHGPGLTLSDVGGLDLHQELLDPRAGAMAAALPAALDGGEATRESAGVLEALLAALDQDEFARVGPLLLDVFASRKGLAEGGIDDRLAARLADLGPASLPVLQVLAFPSRPWVGVGALKGLCRLGKPAAGLADKIAVLLEAPDIARGNGRHAAAYAALMRMGRPDLAAKDPDAAASVLPPGYKEWRASVTPDSPPAVCDHVAW